MRLFIASPVILDDYKTIREDFAETIQGKWVEEENLHLTWLFLGECKDAEAIKAQLAGITPLEAEVPVAGFGYFGMPPRVFFAKAESKLLYEKAEAFKRAGFGLHRFKPHITLCRIKHIHNYSAYREKLESYRCRQLGRVLPGVVLYKSELGSTGPHYTALYSSYR